MNIKASETFGLWLFILVSVVRSNHGTVYTCDPNESCGCSMNSADITRIVNGEDAGDFTWSWAIGLYLARNTSAAFFCGGSILTDRWIISAAHCFINSGLTDPSVLAIMAGSNAQYDFSQLKEISRIIVHPNYNRNNFTNDIALLELTEPLDMTDPKIKRICAPHISSNAQNDEEWPYPGTTVVAVGWGAISEGGPLSTTLLQMSSQVLDDTDRTCARLSYNPSTALCAGVPYNTQDTCQGDSGGPLMMFSTNRQWVLAGLVSFGRGCARPGYSGIYTRVSAFEDWIKSYVTGAIWVTDPIASTTQSTTTTTFPPIELHGNIVTISIYNILIITLFNFVLAFYF